MYKVIQYQKNISSLSEEIQNKFNLIKELSNDFKDHSDFAIDLDNELSEIIAAKYSDSLDGNSLNAMSKNKYKSVEIDIPEIELRYIKPCTIKFDMKLNFSHRVYDLIKKIIGVENIPIQEYFIAVYINRNNKIIGYSKHSKGGILDTIVDPRILLATAIKCLATGIFIAHNHPSGNTLPSKEDRETTKRLAKCAEYFDIQILDHLIVSISSFYSFIDEGIPIHDQAVSGLDINIETEKHELQNKKIKALINKAKHLKF